MVREIKRYKLADISKEELVKKLNKLDFKNGSWQRQYQGKDVMSKCFPLKKSVEVHITIDVGNMNFDDYDNILVLDDDFCQPYTPFYHTEKLNSSFKFLCDVVKAYNNIMDMLVNAGILKNKEYTLSFNTIVRDKVVTQIESEGYECKYKRISDDEMVSKLSDKLVSSAKDFSDNPIAENIADIMEVIDSLKNVLGLEDDTIKKIKEEKKKVRGSYDDCVFLEEAVMK